MYLLTVCLQDCKLNINNNLLCPSAKLDIPDHVNLDDSCVNDDSGTMGYNNKHTKIDLSSC